MIICILVLVLFIITFIHFIDEETDSEHFGTSNNWLGLTTKVL
jgi:hypothetical protein